MPLGRDRILGFFKLERSLFGVHWKRKIRSASEYLSSGKKINSPENRAHRADEPRWTRERRFRRKPERERAVEPGLGRTSVGVSLRKAEGPLVVLVRVIRWVS